MKISISRLSDTTPNRQNNFDVVSLESFEIISQWITSRCWSPIVWHQGERGSSNFYSTELCVLDFDKPGYSIAQCRDDFGYTQHIIGTTKSHQKEKNGVTCDRFRLVIPFERMIFDLQEYEYNLKKIVAKYPADAVCVDGARFYFPCNSIVSVQATGRAQEVYAIPETYESSSQFKDYKANLKFRREKLLGLPPMWVTAALRVGAPIGQRNITCFKVAIALGNLGHSELEVVQLIELSALSGPPDFSQAERRRTIASAMKYVDRD